MQKVHLEAAEDHVERLARERDPIGAIKELIWNALDADATRVVISLELSEIGGVEKVVVEDNGTGIVPDSCRSSFDRIGGSWKQSAFVTTKLKRPLHGKTGQGRLRGYALGRYIRWSTVAEALDGSRYRTVIQASADARNDFEISDSRKADEAVGTRFEGWGRQDSSLNRLTSDQAFARLTTEFAPYLIQYPDIEVIYNGQKLLPQAVVAKTAVRQFSFKHGDDDMSARVRIIEWRMKVDRELHLCDDRAVSVDIIDVGIKAPGFDFTAYVLWDQMADYRGGHLLGEDAPTPVGPLVSQARNELREHFKQRTRERKAELVDKWKAEGVYPYEGKPASEVELLERETFEVVATTVHRHIPRNKRNLKTALVLLRESVKHQPENTHRILDEVFRLTQDDKNELERLLNRTSLSSLIKASSDVADRFDFLAALSHIVFEPETRKLMKERSQLHKILENETWVFGEHYRLLVSDRSLDSVLDRHLSCLGRARRNLDPVRRQDGSVGIVDLMLSRSYKENKRRSHLVVELKAPSVVADQKELAQIKSYALAVALDPQFADVSVEWDFWLVTRDMKPVARAEARQQGRSPGCIMDYAEGSTVVRVWLKRWSEIIEECRDRLHYFREHFEHDPSVEQALAYLEHAHPGLTPSEIHRSE
jgi:hypothetical protein